MISTRHLPWGLALFLAAGCSLINKPDAVKAGGGGGGAGGSSTNTGGASGCKTNDDCKAMTVGCTLGVCTASGTCVAQNAPAGTACGDATKSDCNGADSCDANGACQTNVAVDGTYCGDCAAGPGQCSFCAAGQCGDCTTRATTKTFRKQGSLGGWQLTGGWGLYEQTPPSYGTFGNPGTPPVVFARPVFGTDGNRAHPYPGKEVETSFAVSPPTLIPSSLTFMSWNNDEGSAYDKKTISISVDGGNSFTTVAVCLNYNDFPFCQSGSAAWLPVTIDLSSHPDLVGKVGLVRFSYDTRDDLTGFEQGWYIDELNFAQECGCNADPDCSVFDGTCAKGACDTTNHECSLTPQATNMACGDGATTTCSEADTCDLNGWCNPRDKPEGTPPAGTPCDTCSEGQGECAGCGAGQCLNCPPIQNFDDLSNFGIGTAGWTLTGDWRLTTGAPSASNAGCPYTFTSFPSPVPGASTVVLGTDGVRKSPYCQGAAPGFPLNEAENSFAQTPPTKIPANLTFKSWHVDRGGKSSFDAKQIKISTDGGTTFTTIADCQSANPALSGFKFCDQVTDRMATDWDSITISTGNLAGQTGVFQFTYSTLDTGLGFERGWYIDDIDIMRCDTY